MLTRAGCTLFRSTLNQFFLRSLSTTSSSQKIYTNFQEAVQDIPHGAKLLVGGTLFRH
ncbi:unnamed protein product, partial [Rotaria sp. Silwood1]